MKKLLALLILLPLVITAAPTPPKTEFFWTAPTVNVDGTVLTDLAGFKIYCGSTTGNYTLVQDISNPLQTSHPLSILADGDWYCAMTAYDTALQEGPYSNEINFTLTGGIAPVEAPAAPSFGIR